MLVHSPSKEVIQATTGTRGVPLSATMLLTQTIRFKHPEIQRESKLHSVALMLVVAERWLKICYDFVDFLNSFVLLGAALFAAP